MCLPGYYREEEECQPCPNTPYLMITVKAFCYGSCLLHPPPPPHRHRKKSRHFPCSTVWYLCAGIFVVFVYYGKKRGLDLSALSIIIGAWPGG